MDAEQSAGSGLSRRSALKRTAGMGLLLSQVAVLEAVPFDTDVVGGVVGGSGALFSGVKKVRFNVDVTIEKNDMLLHTRSDNLPNLTNANAWLQGSNNLNGKFVASPNFKGLYNVQTPRVQFLQQGLPQKVAKENSAGNSSAVLTSAKAGDYFDNGSIAHSSHVIQDLYAFFATSAVPPSSTTRSRARAPPWRPPRTAPASSAPPTPRSTPRSPEPRGSATRRPCSRSRGPLTLQFMMFVPTAQLFASMRNAAAAQKLAQRFDVDPGDNGLERFITATRRQNFLVPPRRAALACAPVGPAGRGPGSGRPGSAVSAGQSRYPPEGYSSLTRA
jgi:hypothetical protein